MNNKADIRPLKMPIEIEGAFLIWPIVTLILLLAVAVLLFIYLKRKKHVEEKVLESAMPAEEVAMNSLNSLLEMKLIEKGMIKEYYIKLSDIIRGYIEARYGIFALDKTTWELYQEMRLKRLERVHTDRIRDFLEECDLVKFAKYMPTEKEAREMYDSAKEIVEMTRKAIID